MPRFLFFTAISLVLPLNRLVSRFDLYPCRPHQCLGTPTHSFDRNLSVPSENVVVGESQETVEVIS